MTLKWIKKRIKIVGPSTRFIKVNIHDIAKQCKFDKRKYPIRVSVITANAQSQKRLCLTRSAGI